MFDLTPKVISRAGSVDRWQIVRTARKQTLAEHSFMVAMYSLVLADELEIPDSSRYDMVLHALHHDLSEIFTGDISSVAKDLIRKHNPAPTFDPLECLDRVLPIAYHIKQRATPEAVAVVKLADYIDAIAFLDVERVSEHGRQVIMKLKAKADRYCHQLNRAMPQYRWHQAFVRVLDQATAGEDLVI